MFTKSRYRVSIPLLFLAVLAFFVWPVAAQETEDSTETVLEVHMSDSSVRVITETETREQIQVEDDEFDEPARRSSHFYEDEDGRFYFDEDVVIAADERVRDAVVVLFGDLEIHGEVRGDVVVVMGDLTLTGEGNVGGDAVCLGGQVHSDSTSTFEGEVVSFPISALLTGEGWHILTGEDRHAAEDFIHYPHYNVVRDRLTPVEAILKLLGMLFVALLLQIIFRKRIENVTSTLRFRPWKSLLFGLLFFLGLIVLFIPVIITLVLLLAFLAIILSPIPPLMVLVLVAFLISIATIIIGLVVVPGLMPIFALSRFTFEKRGMNAFVSMLLWILMIWFLSTLVEWVGGVPNGIGILVEIAFYLFGIGAILGSRMGAAYVAPAHLRIPVAEPVSSNPGSEEEPPPAEA